jgi:phosphatidylglycerophosphate synthase
VRAVQTGPVIGLLAQLVLLGVLAATVGLGAAGWAFGVGCAVVMTVLLRAGLAHYARPAFGPADAVTLTRASLAVGVAALVADSFSRPAPVAVLVGLSAVALALDAVDGQVARRTGTASPFGAAFDMEIDAFLILVLSVYVARTTASWVLLIGTARYLLLAAGWVLPWLRATVPPRYWRKVVAGTQGVVLAVAAADVLPGAVTRAALVVALMLLMESFGRDVVWLWRHRLRGVRDQEVDDLTREGHRRSRGRLALGWTLTALALVPVWFALVAPDDLDRLAPVAFARIPIEGLLLVALVVVLRPGRRGLVAAAVGVVLALLTVLKLLDMGFLAALGRPFNPALDWGYLGSAVDLLADSVGRTRALMAVAAAGAVVVAVVVVLPLSVLRLARVAGRHRSTSLRSVMVLGGVWLICAVLGVQVVPGAPVASTAAASLAYSEVATTTSGLGDRRAFATEASVDQFRDTPAADLLTGLRGKDVLVVFVESYGQVAVQGSTFSPGVDAVLDAGTASLHAHGVGARSAWLTSPTFGGISWLAHSTLESGLRIDNQKRYDDLVASDRLTLAAAFKRAGWRTVADVPANERSWPEGRFFYRYDTIYDDHNVGYAGPKFSYASMPDQYVLSAFQRLELSQRHAPVMAEIDLVSSHTPWTPLPSMVPWNAVGDGSVFDPMPASGPSPDVLWRNAHAVQAAYARSIEYSLNAVISFVEAVHDDNLVLVVLGDHQPATIVSGSGASHDVPVSILAHDPAVLARVAGWTWQAGLRPSPTAPVWPMAAFRDRFLAAFGSAPSP